MVVVTYKRILIMATKLGYSVPGQLYVRVITRRCYILIVITTVDLG